MKLRRLNSGELAALATVAAVGATLYAYGDHIFSPGALNATSRRSAPRGGVSSHAETGRNCAACHAPPWSGETMASRCLECHANVRRQFDSGGPLHGQVTNGSQCRSCHTEHHGPQAPLTSLSSFDHNWTAFKLTGKHLTVDCFACHVNQVYQGTAQTCVSCHAEPPTPQLHRSRYGAACAQCHSTTTWSGTVFSHASFPINHGKRGNTCATCHSDLAHLETYTCYNCHEHQPAKMATKHQRMGIAENIDACVRCHVGGRKKVMRASADEPAHGAAAACRWASAAGQHSLSPAPAWMVDLLSER